MICKLESLIFRGARGVAMRSLMTMAKGTLAAPPLHNLAGPMRRRDVAAPVHRRIYKAASHKQDGGETHPLFRKVPVQSNTGSSSQQTGTLVSGAVASSIVQNSTFHDNGKIQDAKHVILDLAYDREDRQIRILWADGHKSTFHLIWLRDEDRSPASYDAATHQRLTDKIPLDIGAKGIEVTDGGRLLQIEWDQAVMGVTRTTFDTTFLRSNCYFAAKSNVADNWGSAPSSVCTWGRELASVLPTLSVPYDAVMKEGDAGERAVLELLDLVRVYGVGIVRDTPRCKAVSQRVVERIAPVRHTLYGGFWETKVLPPDDVDNIDSAYSTVPLPAHTDGNYFEDPPGLQIFHCLQADPGGGDTLLVDGFRVGEELRRRDPDAFALLCEQPVTYRHTDPRNRLEARHAVFGLDPDTGRLARFHYNNLDRAAMRMPPAQVPAFYSAWSALGAAVEDPAGQVWCKLRPGSLIIINNRRVMHGRSRVDGRSGRVLVGCYVTYEDYLSRSRVLRARYGLPLPQAAGGGAVAAPGGGAEAVEGLRGFIG